MKKKKKLKAVNGRVMHGKLAHEIENLLDALHDDILISDGEGLITKVSRTFEEVYGIKGSDVVGKTVYEMEQAGVFKPSIIAIVLKEKTKITMRQKNQKDRDIVVTAIPVFSHNGEIKSVVSFSRDITEYLYLKEQYAVLEKRIEKYTAELEDLKKKYGLNIEGVVANSSIMNQIIHTISKVAEFDATVLFTGPSGVGKTMLARVLHGISKRNAGPFIEINCGAIPENLLESELFGYERGSFTGANKEGKVGLIELAEGGTLFLDEVSELPLSLQVKLLKTIQDKTITRVGGTKEIQVDFRLVTASNNSMSKLVDEGKFREDLYYRLNVISIEIPPLSGREEDIIALIMTNMDKLNKKYNLDKSISPKAVAKLISYNWPGNIRELENVLERAMITADENIIEERDLIDTFRPVVGNKLKIENENLDEALAKLESQMIQEAYMRCGTTVGVAKTLGISQPTAVRKIKKYVRK